LTWSLSGGSLPTGLSLSSAGVISGPIAASATSQTFTVIATDANGVATVGQSLTIVVNAAPTVTGLAPLTALKGSSNVTVVVTGTSFATGARVAFNAITGSAGSITVLPATVNSVTQITVKINIANGNPAKGTYGLVVTNLDGGVSTSTGGSNVFTVN
jgi:hypothetical protein